MERALADKLKTPPRLSLDPIEALYFEKVNKRLNIGAVADLNQTITNPPTQAEVQAISNKIDEILAALRLAGTLAT